MQHLKKKSKIKHVNTTWRVNLQVSLYRKASSGIWSSSAPLVQPHTHTHYHTSTRTQCPLKANYYNGAECTLDRTLPACSQNTVGVDRIPDSQAFYTKRVLLSVFQKDTSFMWYADTTHIRYTFKTDKKPVKKNWKATHNSHTHPKHSSHQSFCPSKHFPWSFAGFFCPFLQTQHSFNAFSTHTHSKLATTHARTVVCHGRLSETHSSENTALKMHLTWSH